MLVAVLLFSNLNKIFVGFFEPVNIFLDNENKYFWGDLTDISAEKEALVGCSAGTVCRCYGRGTG